MQCNFTWTLHCFEQKRKGNIVLHIYSVLFKKIETFKVWLRKPNFNELKYLGRSLSARRIYFHLIASYLSDTTSKFYDSRTLKILSWHSFTCHNHRKLPYSWNKTALLTNIFDNAFYQESWFKIKGSYKNHVRKWNYLKKKKQATNRRKSSIYFFK